MMIFNIEKRKKNMKLLEKILSHFYLINHNFKISIFSFNIHVKFESILIFPMTMFFLHIFWYYAMIILLFLRVHYFSYQ